MSGTSGSALEGRRVAVAESSGVVIMHLRHALKYAGAQIVAVCGSATECVETIRQHKPDLALLECSVSDYLETIDAVRQITEDKATCVVILSDLPEKDEAALLEAGAAVILRKPFSANDLLALLEQTYQDYCTHKT